MFFEYGNLVIDEDWNTDVWPHMVRQNFIPAKHVRIIFINLMQGMDWEISSPVYPITREIAAFIMTEFDYTEELKKGFKDVDQT